MNKKKSGLKSRKKVQSKHIKKHQMTASVHLTREREREREREIEIKQANTNNKDTK